MSKRKTGLGTDAFFKQPEAVAEEDRPEETREQREEPEQVRESKPKAQKPARKKPEKSKPEKVRTTVTLYPETLAAMEALKVEARKQGDKATYSDILNDAIRELVKKRKVKV